MRIKLLLLTLFVITGLSFAQTEYPLVTLQDIQMVPDTLQGTDPKSPYEGDTVRVRGVVLVSPLIDADTARRVIISAGARWVTYIQDPEGGLWGGLNIIQDDTSEASQGTNFDLVDSAQVVEFTGRIMEFNTTTEMVLIHAPEPISVSIIEDLPKRPEPIELTLADLFTEEGQYNFDAEKYEGMYVIFRNVITSDGSLGGGNFKINDKDGHSAFIYNQSRYYKTGTNGEISGYAPPLDGTYLSYLRGIVTTRTAGYYIVPVYPGDVGPSLVSPPSIASIKRDKVEVTSNEAVNVNAKITDFDGFISSATVHYRVNGGERIALPMTKSSSDTTIYEASIPGVADSALVDFYITSKDNQDNESIAPSDTSKQNYYYLVLNRPLTIKDAQYNPWGGNFTPYHSYRITLSGIVTTDTTGISDRTGSGTNRIIMQDGTGPWNGIWLNALNTMEDIYNLKIGDDITVTGVVSEDFNVTRLDSISSLTINSSGNEVPAAFVLETGNIGKKPLTDISAEQYESVLITYENVTITDLNADGAAGPVTNFGEIFINDGTGDTRVELQEGNHYYHNNWDGVAVNPSFTALNDSGSTFESLTGYLYFSFSNYKLIPRNNSDFKGYRLPVSVEEEVQAPSKFVVNQNYPNPFNPSTVISYSIPREGMVTVKVYNVLGQEITTLVNGMQTAGSYKINFDASKLSTGVYFYSVKSGDFSQVKKMMLVK